MPNKDKKKSNANRNSQNDNSEQSNECQAENRQSRGTQNRTSQRDKNFSEDDLHMNKNIEDIFERNNPSHSDILYVLKEIFLSQQFLSAKYDEYLLKSKHLEETCDSLKSENIALKKELKDVQSRIEKNEYILREKNLEIQGIPDEDGENLNRTIMNIANNFDIELQEKDIDYIYRIKKERSGKPGPVIVTFKQRETKEKILSSRKGRSIYAREIGFKNSQNQVYVNEHLTKAKKDLLWKARQLKKQENFKYVWYKHDNIYIRKNDTTKTIKINDESDILKLQH